MPPALLNWQAYPLPLEYVQEFWWVHQARKTAYLAVHVLGFALKRDARVRRGQVARLNRRMELSTHTPNAHLAQPVTSSVPLYLALIAFYIQVLTSMKRART